MKIDLLNTRACLVHLLILSYSSQRQAKLSWLRVFCEFGSHEWSNLQLIFVDLNESGHPCLSMKSTCVYLFCWFLRSLCVCVCIPVYQANGCLCTELLSIHGVQYAYVFTYSSGQWLFMCWFIVDSWAPVCLCVREIHVFCLDQLNSLPATPSVP
jgi:hypothetical protein